MLSHFPAEEQSNLLLIWISKSIYKNFSFTANWSMPGIIILKEFCAYVRLKLFHWCFNLQSLIIRKFKLWWIHFSLISCALIINVSFLVMSFFLTKKRPLYSNDINHLYSTYATDIIHFFFNLEKNFLFMYPGVFIFFFNFLPLFLCLRERKKILVWVMGNIAAWA